MSDWDRSFPEPFQYNGDEPDPYDGEERPHTVEDCDLIDCPICVCQGCGLRGHCVCDEEPV